MAEFSQLEVALFLKEFKSLTVNGDIQIINREGKDFTSLGLTNWTCIDELLDLSVEHYSSGPEPDRDIPGEVWVFGKMIGSVEAYIKLKITKDGRKAICISFHSAERVIKYPFAK